MTKRISGNLTLCFPRCGVKTCPIYSSNTSAFIHPLELWPTPQSTESLFVISDGILLFGYIVMGRCISPQVGRVNIAFMDTFEGSLQSSHTFLSPSYAKTFPAFGYNLKNISIPVTLLIGSQRCPFFFNDITNILKFENDEEKCYVEKSTIINSFITIF